MRLIAALFLLLALPVHAGEPECLPAPFGPGFAFHTGMSLNGQWAWWYCPRADGYGYLNRYVGNRSVTLLAISYRVTAIRDAIDPLAKAKALAKSYATTALTDPSMAAAFADYLADLKANP